MPSNWDEPLGPDLRPLPKYPALDFLRKVEIWQQPGTGSVPVSMPSRDEKTLHELLESFRRQGDTTRLENQARSWLIGYRELSPLLNEEQSAQLSEVIDGPVPAPTEPPVPVRQRYIRPYRRLTVAVIIGIALAGFVIWGVIALAAASNPANPVQYGGQSQSQPKQVAPGSTDLENLESDWGPWRTLATSEQNPQSGAPALLLLNQGGYYASQKWTIPDSREWTQDLGGNVSSVDVEGTHALFQDADGNPWIVGIRQPFVLASNPGTILMIDPAGDVLAVPEAHAIALRMHL
jgi:hypothetical protein